MDWIGEEKEYNIDGNTSRVVVMPIPKGEEVLLQFNGSIKNRKVLDHLLVEHIGLPTYQAFYIAIKRSDEAENLTSLDFDRNILSMSVITDEINEALQKLEDYCRNSDSLLTCYRHLKSTFATTSIIISEFDWSKYGDVSANLSLDSDNINDYVRSALAFMSTQVNPADQELLNFIMMNYQQIASIMLDKKFVNCLALIRPSCDPIIIDNTSECSCSDSDATTVGWIIFALFIILLIILGTFLFLRYSQNAS